MRITSPQFGALGVTSLTHLVQNASGHEAIDMTIQVTGDDTDRFAPLLTPQRSEEPPHIKFSVERAYPPQQQIDLEPADMELPSRDIGVFGQWMKGLPTTGLELPILTARQAGLIKELVSRLKLDREIERRILLFLERRENKAAGEVDEPFTPVAGPEPGVRLLKKAYKMTGRPDYVIAQIRASLTETGREKYAPLESKGTSTVYFEFPVRTPFPQNNSHFFADWQFNQPHPQPTTQRHIGLLQELIGELAIPAEEQDALRSNLEAVKPKYPKGKQ